MARATKPYRHRAYRLKLGPEDSKILRFALAEKRDKTFTTESIDVSASGIAFEIDRKHAPPVNKLLVIEFTIPGREKVTWFARVSRIEDPGEKKQWKMFSDRVIVAIEFKFLPMAFRWLMHYAIKKRREEQEEEAKVKAFYRFWGKVRVMFPQFMFFVFSTMAMLLIFYILTKPGPNYSIDNIVPFGTRF